MDAHRRVPPPAPTSRSSGELAGARRWGGVIEWFDAPFELFDGGRAAGLLIDSDLPQIWLVRAEPIERTALAYEVAHLLFGDPDPLPPEAQAWVVEANAAIAIALGRVSPPGPELA